MAGVRFVLAGVVLLILTRLRGEGWPTRRAWLVAVPAGGLLFLGGNGAVVLAEKTVPSSVAAVVCATTPLIAAAVAMLRGERPGRGDMLGMVLGLAGVVVLGAGAPIIGAGPCEWLVFASPVTFALGSLMVRAQGPGGGLGSAAAQMLMGGAWLLVASVAAGERAPEQVSSGVLGAWLWLVVFGSLVGFSAYTWLLRNAPPALSMSYAYVNPIVAVLLGVLLGGERLCGASIAATCLIAVGVMSAVLLRRSPSRVRVS
jgi:drug/metabolite transporter (DMT)-like permease